MRVDRPPGGWCATERQGEVLALWPEAGLERHGAAERYPVGPIPDASDALDALVRSRLEMCGPLAARTVAEALGVAPSEATQALGRLEARGVALRGRYDPGVAHDQWCDRRLLARIHRYTLGRLRQEIEPVSGTTFMRFLLDWQHLSVETRLAGAEGLAAVVAQLAGFEAPAASWEGQLLAGRPARLSGRVAGRPRARRARRLATPHPKRSQAARQAGTLKSTPLALLPRGEMRAWLDAVAFEHVATPGGAAGTVLALIEQRGAAFFDDIVAETGLLRTQVEGALDELAAGGLVTCDSFAGLRALTLPAARRNGFGRRTRRTTQPGLDEAGRWDLVRRRPPPPAARQPCSDEALECLARGLLRRYGVVFRGLLERESGLPPWRYLLWTLRRLEDAGEVRGGRFRRRALRRAVRVARGGQRPARHAAA